MKISKIVKWVTLNVIILTIITSLFLTVVSAEEVFIKYQDSLTLSRIPEESKLVVNAIQYSLLAQTAAVTVAQASSSALSLPGLNLLEYIKYLFSVSIVKRRKKKTNWGLVYNASDAKPIAFAVIRIYAAESNKLVNTTVSDIEGRYGLLLDSGEYYLKVEHQDFNFIENQKASSATINDVSVYNGGVFDTNVTASVNFNLPLTPKQIKRKFSIQSLRIWWRNSKLSELTADPYYIAFFFLLNLGLCLFSFNIIYVILTLFYGVNLLMNILSYLAKPARTWGRVLSAEEEPVSHAFVKIYQANSDKLIDTIITDDKGRFQIFIEKGNYQVMTQAHHYVFPSKLRYENIKAENAKALTLEIGDNDLNIDLYMDRINHTNDQQPQKFTYSL